MKYTISLISIGLLVTAACSNFNNENGEIDRLREEAIAVHDEIMPQISAFDRNTVKIDSILANLPELQEAQPDLDTTQTRTDLSGLKNRLELATDSMMSWMTAFDVDPQDKSAAEIKVYYEEEIEKVKEMKQLFDNVSKEATEKLAKF